MKKEQKIRFLELRASGKSYDEIARELGVSKQSLLNYSIKRAKVLANSSDFGTDAWEEEFLLRLQPQLEFIARNLRTIMEQLEKRDLSDVATPELIEMFKKHYKKNVSEALREELDSEWGGMYTDTWWERELFFDQNLTKK